MQKGLVPETGPGLPVALIELVFADRGGAFQHPLAVFADGLAVFPDGNVQIHPAFVLAGTGE